MTTKTLELPAVGEPILTLKAVNKSYGAKRAAQDVNLSIPRGAIHGFLGPNGAGKTTTIRAIMKILLPDSGEIRLGGQLLDGSMRDRIGYLPEERGLYRKMKCVEQLAYLAELKGVPRREAIVVSSIRGDLGLKTIDGWKFIDSTGGGNSTSWDSDDNSIPGAAGTNQGVPKQLFHQA